MKIPVGSAHLRCDFLRQVVLALFLGNVVTSAVALDVTRYLPLTPGNQWSFRNSSGITQTVTIGSAVVMPSGVAALPLKTTQSNTTGYAQTFYTNDADGLRDHQEFASTVYVSGYGYVPVTVTLAPPAILAPANPVLGGTYTSAGTVSYTIGNLGTFPLNYTTNTRIVGFEQVTNYSGTQTWLALKVIPSLSITGTVNGRFLSNSTTSTYWFADGVGFVKGLLPNASGVMETWQLTSTNVVPPLPSDPLLHPFVFDPIFYLTANPDLQQAFGSNPEAAQNHWISSGLGEGRLASAVFSVNWYRYKNYDLGAFGGNNELYIRHYVQNGIQEGRESAVNFSVRDYLSFNLDLASAFNANYSAATSHYINNGMSEGRRSSQYFSPKQYLANNRDLASALGSNYSAATMHYILHGMSEGRVVDPSYPVAPRVVPPMNPVECLFGWAERTYPSLFSPGGSTTATMSPYIYRFYGQTNSYLGYSSTDKHVYYLGALTNNSIRDIGALSDWLATANCQ